MRGYNPGLPSRTIPAMDPQLQKRLIGAAVLIVLAAIFLPMLLDGPEQAAPASADIPLAIPDQPAREYQVQDVPLDLAQAPAQPAPNAVSGAIDPNMTAVAPMPDETIVAAAPDAAPAKIDAISGEVLVPASPGPQASVNPPANSPTASSPVAPTDAVTTETKPATAANTAPTKSTGPKFTPPPMPITSSRPPAATAEGGRYFVSLGAFANQNNVAQLRASLSAQGFAVVDDTVSIAGKPATRLRVGPYAMRSDAEAMRQKITAARPDLKPSISEDDAGAATAVTTASAPVGSGFAVQVGAFKDQAEANKLREQLRAARFAAYVESLRTEQGQLYRVRVGPEAERGNAEKLRDAIKARFNLNGNVVRHP